MKGLANTMWIQMTRFVFILLCFANFSSSLQARVYVPEVPSNPNFLDFYLLTTEPGNMVADRFGHTAIRVVNKQNNTDIIYNWGLYDFSSPTFLYDFFRGHLKYTLGLASMNRHLEIYRIQQRKMWQENLNLTNKQKIQLMKIIAHNSQAENRTFMYDYWFKNCSTIPRDHIDQVVNHRLKDKYSAQIAEVNFRYFVRKYLEYFPIIPAALEIVMTDRIDPKISYWEEMFLPMALRKHLLSMPAIDDQGREIAGRFLLENTQVLLDFPEHRSPYPGDFWVFAAVFLLMTLVLVWLFSTKRPIAHKFLGAMLFGWGAVAGTMGIIILIGWFATEHKDLENNANLLLYFGGLDFYFMYCGWKLFRAEGLAQFRYMQKSRMFELGLKVHFVLAVIALLLYVTGFVVQDLSLTVSFTMFPLLVFTYFYYRYSSELLGDKRS